VATVAASIPALLLPPDDQSIANGGSCPPSERKNDSLRLAVAQREQLLPRLAERTGPDAADCGTFTVRSRDPDPASRRARIERAVGCIQAESLRHRPARLLIQIPGVDTWIVHGLFTKTEGGSGRSGMTPIRSAAVDHALKVGRARCQQFRRDRNPSRISSWSAVELRPADEQAASDPRPGPRRPQPQGGRLQRVARREPVCPHLALCKVGRL
jgi:hypothetical protein